MKSVLRCILLLTAGAALFLTGTWHGRQAAIPSAALADRRVLYYVDPMNPRHISDQPGLAPCGMKMEPVYAESGSWAGLPMESDSMAPGTVRISLEKQQLIGVTIAPVEQGLFTHSVRLFGRVVPDDRRIYRLNAGVEGIVREVSAVTTGSEVKQDQWLATFSAPDTRTSIQGFLTAVDVVDRQKLSGANTLDQLSIVSDNARLAADRLQNLGLSTLQIEEIRATREVPSALRILAPADGLVLAQEVTPGLKFEKGTEWYRIADLSRVWVLADVYANEAEYVHPGALAEVSLNGRRRSLPARVSEVLPQFDPVTRTLKVRFEVDNPGIVLRPEMFVDVELPVTLPPTLAVSVDAVLHAGRTATVFVDRGNGFFEPRAVETGRRLGNQVEIVRGLEPGERIVTSGNFLLDSESRMKLAAFGSPRSATLDPICWMKMDESKARATHQLSEYRGKTYYFCNAACKRSFDENPARFAQEAAELAQSPPTPGL